MCVFLTLPEDVCEVFSYVEPLKGKVLCVFLTLGNSGI